MAWRSIPNWNTLPSAHRTRPDPYCVWAELTGWAHYPMPDPVPPPPPPVFWLARVLRCVWGRIFGPPYEQGCAPAANPRDPNTRAVILELLQAADAERFIDIARTRQISVPAAYDPRKGARRTRFMTARATATGLAALADPSPGEPGQLVARFDLCDFAKPRRMMKKIGKGPWPAQTPPALAGGKLVAVIDDGCGFAHPSFVRLVGGAPSARVAAFWDQDVEPLFEGGPYGERPAGFAYGWQVYRAYPPASPNFVQRKGLNDWLAKFWSGAARSLAEDSCYVAADYASMRRRVAHGVHVMDVLAGPVRQRDRVFIDRTSPPSWRKATDAAADPAQCEIAFVQLPRAGLQDTSGGWLDAYVLDALRCIADWRGAGNRETVISLSYGSSVGPHDASTILAGAMDELLAQDGTAGRPLDLVLAAGNAYSARGHGVADVKANDDWTITWRVLPSTEAPSFLQLWLPCAGVGVPAGVAISITPPGGAAPATLTGDDVQVLDAGAGPSAVAAFLRQSSRGAQAMVLVALSPTLDQGPQPAPVAMHGDWKVNIRTGAAPLGIVHAYVASNEKRMAGLLRGRQSYLVEDPARPYVQPRGTLNGIGGGAKPTVVAGYNRRYSDRPAEGAHAPYSSAGMGADPLRKRQPDAAFPTDQSDTLRGIRAAGTRGGSTYRMVGTSAAAPMRARALLAGTAAPPPSAGDADLDGTQGRWPLY